MSSSNRSADLPQWRALLLDRLLIGLTLLSLPFYALLLLSGGGRAPLWMRVLTAILYSGPGVLYFLRGRVPHSVRAASVTAVLLAQASYAAWAVGYVPGLPLLYALTAVVAALCHGPRAGAVVFTIAALSVWALNAAVHVFGYEPPLAVPLFGARSALVWVRMSLGFTVLCGAAVAMTAYAGVLAERYLGALGGSVHELEREIDRRKLAEAQREQATAELLNRQKFEVVARLSGRVAHDFNNALTIILASTERLRHMLGNEPHTSAELDAIDRTAKSAADVSRSLILHSRSLPSPLQRVRLDRFLHDAASMIERALPLDVTLELEARAVAPILADPLRLDQALLNLLFNARDAMPGGGRLSVRTLVNAAGTHVALQVCDTGVGMDAPTRARIFEPFFTTKAERGTGLGLSSVHAIVSEAAGTVEVHSEPGAGSAFTLWFPIAAHVPPEPEAVPMAPAVAPQSTDASNGHTILLVEDEPILRRAFEALLSAAGYGVAAAGDGDSAIRLVRQRAGQFALLLTDGAMPGAPVAEVISTFRQHNGNASFVICSGHVTEELHALAQSGGHVLQKPFGEQELLAMVRRCHARA